MPSVYGIGLYAVSKPLLVETHAARLGGSLQELLGLLVLVDIQRRFVVSS